MAADFKLFVSIASKQLKKLILKLHEIMEENTWKTTVEIIMFYHAVYFTFTFLCVKARISLLNIFQTSCNLPLNTHYPRPPIQNTIGLS